MVVMVAVTPGSQFENTAQTVSRARQRMEHVGGRFSYVTGSLQNCQHT